MIKHRRERRRSAAVQHGEQRLYLTKRSSPGNIEQTVPSYSIRLFSLNLVHLELAYQFVQFLVTDLAPRSDTRASKVIYLQKEAWKKRERENSATKLASRIAARGIAVEIVATLQRDGGAEEEERVDCARLSYNAKNIR